MTTPAYGDLIRVDSQDGALLEVIRRVRVDTGVSGGNVVEPKLQEILFRFPQTLPIAAIDAAYTDAIPICRELRTGVGQLDALYVNARGRLILAEFKLWRNPQARREVIGQILDYATALASWGYEDLQRQVSLALDKSGNVLYDLVSKHCPGLNEAEFVDNVTRHLKRGEFLLLIAGDGIQENAAKIVDFVQRHSGLHFNLALVEAALYRDASDHLIVQPRVLARTVIVQRFVIDGSSVEAVSADEGEEGPTAQQEENRRFWTAVLHDYKFADPTVDVPKSTTGPTVYVGVRNSGYGDEGPWFTGYLQRSGRSALGCYMTARKGIERAARIFDELAQSLDELREELGDELEAWNNTQGRPRIGFQRKDDLSFLAGSEDSDEYAEAVSWMRDHLNLLVSGLHPRIQSRP